MIFRSPVACERTTLDDVRCILQIYPTVPKMLTTNFAAARNSEKIRSFLRDSSSLLLYKKKSYTVPRCLDRSYIYSSTVTGEILYCLKGHLLLTWRRGQDAYSDWLDDDHAEKIP